MAVNSGLVTIETSGLDPGPSAGGEPSQVIADMSMDAVRSAMSL